MIAGFNLVYKWCFKVSLQVSCQVILQITIICIDFDLIIYLLEGIKLILVYL